MRPAHLAVLAPLLALGALACSARPGTIGAILGQREDGQLFVRETPARLAAREAGLQPGDQILLIDGRDVRRLSPARLHELLSGDPGTKVKLTVIRGDDVIRVTVGRRPAPPSATTRATSD